MKLFKLLSPLVIVLMLASLWGCSGSGDSSSNLAKGSKITAKLVGGEIKVSGATDDQSNPRVVFLADKNLYFAVWEDYKNRNLTGSDIYGQFIDQSGNLCSSAPILISHNSGTALQGNQTVPDVAYKQDVLTPSNSKLVVVWQDTVGGSASGYVGYATVTTLPSALSATACGSPSTVAGTATVSDAEYMNFNQLKEYNVANTTLGLPKNLTVNAGTFSGSTVLVPYVVPGSVKITGSFIKTVADPAAVPPVAQATVVVDVTDDGAGGLIGAGILTGIGGSSIDYSTGQLSVALIAFVAAGAPDATFTITYNTYLNAISDRTDSLLSRKSPRVSYDPNRDEFWTTWVESRNVNNISSVSCFGQPVTWQYGDANYIGYARIKGDGTGFQTNAMGVFGADIIRNTQTSMNRLLASSSTALSQTYEYEFFTRLNNPVIASDPTSPETLIAWEGVSNKATISCSRNINSGIVTSTLSQVLTYGSGVAGDGVHIYSIFDKQIFLPNTLSTWVDFLNNEPISATAGTAVTTGTNPSVAVDNTSTPRKFLVAWEDNRNGNTTSGANTKIYGQLINSGGGIYNTNRILSYQDSAGTGANDTIITNSRQTRPFVSYDAVNQRYFVMWQDERNSSTSLANIDLYGQYVNLDGSLSGANYAISSNPSNQLAPSLAYDSYTKQFLSVWKDARTATTTASDVYGQLFSLGQPQLTLLTATKPAEQLVPAVHDFLAVNVGTAVTWPFIVKNSGDAALNISDLTKQPGSPFSIAPTNAATLAPGSSATYTVTYLPTSSGTYNSSFTLESDGGSQTVALSATGVGLNPLTITTPSGSSLPDASTNVDYSSVQMVAAGGYTPLTWSAIGFPPFPSTMDIDPKTGKIFGKATTPGNYTIVVTVTDGTSPTHVSFSRTYSLRVGSIAIATTPLSAWTQSVDYFNAPIHSVSGTGTGSLSWMLLTDSGSAPPGISMDSAGVFSGAATKSGAYFFTVEATDSSNQIAQKNFFISINPKPVITTDSLPAGIVGKPYSKTLSVGGGTPALVWSLSGGLPVGLLFDTATGAITGTPTASDSYDLTFTIKDAAGVTDSKKMTLEIVTTSGSTSPSGGSTNTPPPSTGGGGGGCFIATAAYGSYLDPHVMVLRHFRDNVLLQSELGTAFVTFYYKHSPPIADFIAQHDTLRMLFRFALTPLIFGAEYPLALGLIFALATVWYIRRRLGAKAQAEMV